MYQYVSPVAGIISNNMPRAVYYALSRPFICPARTHSLIHFCLCVDICDVQTDCSRMMAVAL